MSKKICLLKMQKDYEIHWFTKWWKFLTHSTLYKMQRQSNKNSPTHNQQLVFVQRNILHIDFFKNAFLVMMFFFIIFLFWSFFTDSVFLYYFYVKYCICSGWKKNNGICNTQEEDRKKTEFQLKHNCNNNNKYYWTEASCKHQQFRVKDYNNNIRMQTENITFHTSHVSCYGQTTTSSSSSGDAIKTTMVVCYFNECVS